MSNEGDAVTSGKKKRKNTVISDLGVESNVRVADKDHPKKKKFKVSGDMSEGVPDLDTDGDMNELSRKEKKKKDRTQKDANAQEDDNEREGKSKKGKTRPSSAEIVSEAGLVKEGDEHAREEGHQKKKSKSESKSKKKQSDNVIGVSSVENHTFDEANETVQPAKKKQNKVEEFVDASLITTLSGNNDEDDRLGGDSDDEYMKKKKKKKTRAEKCNDNENYDASKFVGDVSSIENSTDQVKGSSVSDLIDRINDEVIKEKKRKKKKKDSSLVGTSDEELGNTTHIAPSSDSVERVKKSSKKKKGKSHVTSNDDANVDILENNKKNEATEPSEKLKSSEKSKKVKFSENVEVFPLHDSSSKGKKKQRKDVSKDKSKVDDGLIRGKRFSKEEDEIVRDAVMKYIEDHQLGEKGLEMVLKCKSHPELKDCWKEIGEGLPHRPYIAVYSRAHILFEGSESHKWTEEELELLKKFYEKHGPDWRTLADELGKHRFHVKDAWRRIKLPNRKKGNWSQEEYQELFNLVNVDLSMKAFSEKKTKYGMLRDNIPWEAISEQLSTRSNSMCCLKWYKQLVSPMVAEGLWANTDDYRLLITLGDLDASCEEDVDWDNLLEHRSGDICLKRWNQMVRHIGEYGTKSFSEQVDLLSQRYCANILEARESYDNKIPVD